MSTYTPPVGRADLSLGVSGGPAYTPPVGRANLSLGAVEDGDVDYTKVVMKPPWSSALFAAALWVLNT
jgi:hypothetical protein